MDLKAQLKQAADFLAEGKYQDALKIYQAILAENPKHPIALQATGQIAYQVGNFEAAEDYFQKSLTENPGQYRIWIMLGETCVKNRKAEKAVQAYRNAITIRPKSSEAYLRLGNILNIIGKNEEAGTVFEKAFLLDEAGSSAFRRLNMVSDVSLDSPVAREARRRLDQGLEDKMAEAYIHYGFAYLYEKLGDSDKFFTHLHEANRRQRALSPPWQDLFAQNIKDIKATFRQKTLEKTVPESEKIITPIFVVGMPRSGTTLVEQIIATHPQVFGADEMDTLTRFVINQAAIWTQKPLLNGINDLDIGRLTELSRMYQTRTQKLAPETPYITDKFLANYMAIGLIRMIMPWARVVVLKRHPMDVALSIYKNYFVETLNFCFDLEDMAIFTCLYRGMIKFWEELIPGFIHTVSYETLVTNFESETHRLIDFCGLPWNPACLEPHKNTRAVLTLSQDQVRKPVYKSSIGKWKAYEKELEPFRQACLKLGYNVDEYDGS